MNYKQTLEFMYAQLPMYQRQGATAFKKDIGNIVQLCSFLGNPQDNFKSIHIAGTNGKGSVTHMLASILVEYGYEVGLYTSPHYKDFRERIKINADFISKKEVVRFIERIKPALQHIPASFFEMTVAMAFYYFSRQKVDFAIIETGLGGRLDSTNIILPIISIITNISFDHVSMLGNTLEQIAGEKAGIIKKNTPVVVGEKKDKTYPVFMDRADSANAEIVFAEDVITLTSAYQDFESSHFVLQKPKDEILKIEMDFAGPYQQENLITSIAGFEMLCKKRFFDWNSQHIENGFLNLKRNVAFIGRWEKLGESPTVIADSAHNEAGLSYVLERLNSMKFARMHFVLGFVNDKNLEKTFQLFPKDADYYFSQAKIPRALPGAKLKSEARMHDLIGRSYVSISNALKAAKRKAKKEDLIYVGGSIFVVAEVLP